MLANHAGHFQAVKIERQGGPVPHHADGDSRLPIGQIGHCFGQHDLHFNVRMRTRKFGQIRHEQVHRQKWRQRDPQQPPHVLIAPEDARFQLM